MKRSESEMEIEKIDSFIIVVSSPRTPLSQSALHGQWENNPAVGAAGEALKKIKCQSKILSNLQKYNENRAKYEGLLQYTPKARPSSSGCRKRRSRPLPYKVNFLAYNERTEGERMEGESSIWKGLPVLRVQPVLVSLYHEGRHESFLLLQSGSNSGQKNRYLAMHTGSRTLYTLKMISRKTVSPVQLEQLIASLKLQTFLSHPNILKLYHVLTDPHFIILLLQPSPDEHLGQNKSARPEKEVKEIVKQICRAAEYMHKNDVIHRGLRPEAIFLHEGVVKIDSFEAATYAPLLRTPKSKLRLRSTMESLTIDVCDTKTDLWNIGILTYQLLFGRIPIEIESSSQCQSGLFFPQDGQVSDCARDFISGCLSKNTMNRLCIRQAQQHPFLKGADKYRWTTA